jgi:hypothetical protein
MPANGNAGWIDEAIATWRDNGYPTPDQFEDRDPVNLAGFSAYRRTTPNEAYTDGAWLISELDRRFQSRGGMIPLLRKFYDRYRRLEYTTPLFQQFLEEEVNQSLKGLFTRFVFGKGRAEGHYPKHTAMVSKHPRAFTLEEEKRLR